MVHSWLLDVMDADELREKTDTEISLLHQAILAGQEDTAIDLIPVTANLNTMRPENLNTPIHDAVWKEMTRLVAALLKAGANPDLANDAGASALHSAAHSGNLEIVRMLVAQKAWLDRQAHSQGLHTPLMYAVKEKHFQVAKFLLDAGADPFKRTKWEQTAFDFAAENKDADMLRLLGLFRNSFKPKNR